MTAPALVPVHRRPLSRISEFDVGWAAREHTTTAYTGQVGVATFATANNLIGSDGATVAALPGMPRWQMLDLEAGVAGRETASLLFGDGDTVTWTVAYAVGACTMLLELVQPASQPATGTGLLYLGNDGVTAARLAIDSNGTYYRARYHNGTSEQFSTLAVAPSSGQYVRLRLTLSDTGVVQLHQSLAFSGTETSATAGDPLTLANYGVTTKLRLNGMGTSSRTAFAAVRVVLVRGLWSLSGLVNRY